MALIYLYGAFQKLHALCGMCNRQCDL